VGRAKPTYANPHLVASNPRQIGVPSAQSGEKRAWPGPVGMTRGKDARSGDQEIG